MNAPRGILPGFRPKLRIRKFTYVILPKGCNTDIKSVSLQPSATALQWMTRENGVLWCAAGAEYWQSDVEGFAWQGAEEIE